MSKAAYIARYALILKKLKAAPYSTIEEIKDFIDRENERMSFFDDRNQMSFSTRTFHRDKKEIRDLFGIEIGYSPSSKGYYLRQQEIENAGFLRMVESFEIFNSLNQNSGNTQYIFMENRQPKGTEHLFGILHAVKNEKCIEFLYQKFWEDDPTLRLVEPYALKEFKSRWYLIAIDRKDKRLKTFGLDRISELTILSEGFKRNLSVDINEIFRHAFGIICPTDQQPQKVVLTLDPEQGKYIKSLPIHSSQKILVDNDKELRIELLIYLTHDFFMEMLSLGSNVRVIEPKEFGKKLKTEHENSAELS
ncbi:MAG: WYL domain-containing protein [Crocinitomicaceae bacterium]|nr:WYL domain-containing protein [Crocinitomicaceae bacterium]MBK8926680.1 WYL domain-containing protein [Crocinitomicaceae bacterium]